MSKEDYLNLRNKYLPKNLKLVFILESPPHSGGYFYNPKGKTTEHLFSAMMRCVLNFAPDSKEKGLKEFRDKGYFLVDASYTPVNHLPRAQRKHIILRDYKTLVKDLRNLIGNKKIPVTLVKANICRLLEERLKKDRFNVINKNLVIPFPSNGWQKKFCIKIKQLI